MFVCLFVCLLVYFARRLFPPHESSARAQHVVGKREGSRSRGMQRRDKKQTSGASGDEGAKAWDRESLKGRRQMGACWAREGTEASATAAA